MARPSRDRVAWVSWYHNARYRRGVPMPHFHLMRSLIGLKLPLIVPWLLARMVRGQASLWVEMLINKLYAGPLD